MFWIPLAVAGMQAVSAAANWLGTKKQADAQRRQGDLLRQQALEQDRRTRLQQAQVLGSATAGAGASGAEIGSTSLQQYLSTMADEFRKQADWQKNAGLTEASLVSAGAKSMETAGGFAFGADISKALYGFGSANNWFQGAGGGGGASPSASSFDPVAARARIAQLDSDMSRTESAYFDLFSDKATRR